MSSRLFLLFSLSIISIVVCAILNIVSCIWFSVSVAGLVLLVDRMPKAKINFDIYPSPNSNGWIVKVENLGSDKVSKITYDFQGRLKIDSLPSELETGEKYESLICLSLATGSEFDVTISYSPPMSMRKSKQRFRGSSGGAERQK